MEWENAMQESKKRFRGTLLGVEDIGLAKLKALLGEGWEALVRL